MGKALLVVALIGGAVLWFVSRKTGTDFSRTAAARDTGGHSILKSDAEPQPIKVVGSFVNTGEEGRTILIQGRTEDCEAGVPGCFSGEVLMMIHNPDSEQVRIRPPFYRGTHYFIGVGGLRNDEAGTQRPINHYGSLSQAKEKR
jgi:hypothetical protein